MAQMLAEAPIERLAYITETRLDHCHAVGNVIAAMRSDFAFPHTIETLAEIANYSPFHFARLFRHITGSSPGEFLSALRFDAARHRMLETTDSITDICFDVGFSSLGTFSSRFKQLVGLGPAEFRNMPEPLMDNLPKLGDRCPIPQNTGSVVSGTVSLSKRVEGFVFIGLYPSTMPQGRPVAGTMMLGPGPFVIPDVPPGTWRILSAIFPLGDDPLVHLLGSAMLQGFDALPIEVSPGFTPRLVSLHLREPMLTDGPILSALAPALLGL